MLEEVNEFKNMDLMQKYSKYIGKFEIIALSRLIRFLSKGEEKSQ